MKEFFKYVLATIVGVVAVSIIMTVLGILSIAGMVASSSSTTTVEKNSVLVLKLSGVVNERSDGESMAALQSLLGQSDGPMGLGEICSAIKKAKENENIKGIYIEADGVAANPATLTAIRNALADFKKSGKFILSYGDNYGQSSYYVASVADSLLLNPQGKISLTGLASQVMYYKDALDKLGVQMQVFRVGAYKSAVEPYLTNKMSDENREQITSFLGDVWSEITKAISEGRNVPVDSINSYVDNGIFLTKAEEYVEKKLVDKLCYTEDIAKTLKTMMNLGEDEDYNKLYVSDMAGVENKPNRNKEGEIAVYYAYGEIGASSVGGDKMIEQKKVCEDLRSLRDDENVKAVVFRVNSPGGSAFDSDQMWKEVVELRKVKPVVVSMGDYAASGGYYISCAASYIFAEPTTLTGSIGIFGMFPEASQLIEKTLGIHVYNVATNRHSVLGSPYSPIDAEGADLVQNMINNGYETFTSRVAEGRKMDIEEVKRLGGGRVWTGNQAKANGLVDELGGLDDAIKKAKELAKVEDTSLGVYPEEDGMFSAIFNKLSGDDYIEAKMNSLLGDYSDVVRIARNLDRMDNVQARIPFAIKIR